MTKHEAFCLDLWSDKDAQSENFVDAHDVEHVTTSDTRRANNRTQQKTTPKPS